MATRPSPLNGHKLLTNGDRRLRSPIPSRRNGYHRRDDSVVPTRSITSEAGKFGVGLLAGLSLVFLPPFVTALAPHETESHIALFTASRLSIGVTVAVFIAILTTLQEYQKAGRPWSIFMRALALPGLVLGSWQSLNDNARLREKDGALHEEEKASQEATGFRVITPDLSGEAPIVPSKTSSLTPDGGIQYASLLPPDLLRPSSYVSASVEERRYLLVVDRRPDSTGAAARAQELQAICCPGAAYLRERPGGSWFVLESTESRTHAETMRRAIALTRQYPKLGLGPQLLAVSK